MQLHGVIAQKEFSTTHLWNSQYSSV